MMLFAFLFESWLSTLAVAGGAAAVPVIIHLLNRRRFRIVTWAAMRFLLAAQRKNARRMRLEQLVLLALRVLMVLLLVLAMASVLPWAEHLWRAIFPENIAFAAAGQARTHKILVLDGSFSMARKVGDSTCFERARALAERLVRESPRGDCFNLVLMSAPPRRVVPEPSEDGRKVGAEVRGLRLPHGNADVLATLHAVEDLLRHSPGKFSEREVWFLTDLQQSTWISKQPGNVAPILEKIRGKARTVFLDVGEETANNLAVTSLALAAPLASTGSVTPIMATLHNYGPETREQVRVELLVGRARAASADSAFEPRVAHQAVVKLGRGANVVTFPYKFTTPGDHVIQVRLENDSLELDDVRSAAVGVKTSVPVLLVNGKLVTDRVGGKLADEGTEWLRIALNPFETGSAPGGIPARPKVITERDFNDATTGNLTPYDAVYLCDVKQLTPAEVRRLETHLRAGGGVVVALGDGVDFGAYNELLYRNGGGILPARLIAKQAAPKDWFFHLNADTQAWTLPPLDAFTEDADRVSLLTARFRQYVRTEASAKGSPRKVLSFLPAWGGGVGPKPKEPEGTPSGDPALIEWQPLLPPAAGAPPERGPQRARGRVVLVTTTLNMDWTTWPASPSYLALMQEVLAYSLTGRLREQSVAVGEPLEEFLQTTGGGLDVAVTTPDGRTESVQTVAHEDVSVFRWLDTDVSGIYRAVIGGHPQEHLFAVNVPTATDAQQASESDPTRTSGEELQKTYPEWELQVVRDPSEVVRGFGGGVATTPEMTVSAIGTVIARWLLLAVLVLVLAEVVMAWRFGHYSAVAGTPGGQAATGKLLPGFIGLTTALAFIAAAVVLGHAAWTGDFLGFLPETMRHGLEQAFGVPPPATGEGTRWRLEFLPYLWNAAADPWLAGTLAVGATALIVVIYRLEGQTASLGYKLLLSGVRVSFLLLLLAVLLPQLRLWFERQGWPDVAIVLDDSASMGTVDRYRDPRVQAAADQLAKDGQLSEPTRLALAQALLGHKEKDWLGAMLARRQVKLHIYRCAARAQRIADVTGAEEIEPALKRVHELRADSKHDSSQLGTAVRQVLNDFRGSSLAAVILLTDGVTTEGEDLVKVSKYAAQVGVPLFLVGIGDSHEQRDLALHDLQAEDAVYVNDRIVFELRLTGTGYSDLNVPVRLREKGKERVLAEQRVSVDSQGKPVKVRLVHQPTEPGEKTFVVDVPVQPDESQPENNKLERVVYVRESKLIKVLYVEREPRYEYRFIKTLLERESARIKGNKSVELKVFLVEADPDFPIEDRTALAEFPTRTELQQYDVVLLGDVDPRHPLIGDKNIQALAEFVREKGGGLLMIAGPRHAPYDYRTSALKDVLPIEVLRGEPPEEPAGGRIEGYRPELTAAGRMHPIFRFSPDERENEEVWRRLREMYWWSEGYRLKPAAEVLAVHPRFQPRPEERGLRGDEGHPLVVQHFVGAGRCMFFGFEETWRWRKREDELRFNQFWIQTIRYLARSRVGRIELRLDRQTPYRRGEPIKMTVRFPDDQAPPAAETEVKVVVERRPPRPPGGGDDAARAGQPIEVQTVQLARLDGSRSTFEGLLTRTPEGEYQFWLSAPVVAGSRPRAECRVLAPPGEMELLRMNGPDMERAAEESRGRFYTLAEADRLVADLPAGTRVTLNATGPPWLIWNHPAVFALALGLLTGEWILRKRKSLL